MSRPKRTPADENQAREHAKLREWDCRCVDTHDLPGRQHKGEARENPLDAFVLSPCRLFWLQVEWKAASGESFTPNEREYLKSLGIWDLVQSWLEPVELWRRTDKPVVVAWKAEQVMAVFEAMARRRTL